MERFKGQIMKHFACCAKEENSISILNGEVKAKDDVKCVPEVSWLVGYVCNSPEKGIKKKHSFRDSMCSC